MHSVSPGLLQQMLPVHSGSDIDFLSVLYCGTQQSAGQAHGELGLCSHGTHRPLSQLTQATQL